jgi:hypothetical protein
MGFVFEGTVKRAELQLVKPLDKDGEVARWEEDKVLSVVDGD